MKAIWVFVLLSLLSFQLEAKRGVSLNEAVNQVKSEGRVLSAKTVNGRHEIKILTPNGTVKTINKKAGRAYSNPGTTNLQEPQTLHNKFKDAPLPSRHQSSRNLMILKERNARSRQGSAYNNNSNRRNVQQTSPRATTRNRSASKSSSNDKDK